MCIENRQNDSRRKGGKREQLVSIKRSCSPTREKLFSRSREQLHFSQRSASLRHHPKLPRSLLGIAKIDESVYGRAASPKDSVQSPMLCRNRMRRKERKGKGTGTFQKCRARVRLSGDAHPPTFGLRKSTPLGCATWHPQLAQPNTPGLSNLRSSPSHSKDAWSSFALSPKPTGKTSHYQSNAKCRAFTTHARRFETWNKRSSRVQSGRWPMSNPELHAVLTGTHASSNCNSQKFHAQKCRELTCRRRNARTANPTGRSNKSPQ